MHCSCVPTNNKYMVFCCLLSVLLFYHPPAVVINLSPSSPAYMRQWIGSALLQIMACRLFGVKPLSKPMLGYCQLDSWEQVSIKFWAGILLFSFTKMHLKMSSAKMATILSWGRWVKPGIQQSHACNYFPTDTYFNQSNPGDSPRSISRVLVRTSPMQESNLLVRSRFCQDSFLVPHVIWASG